MIKITKNEFESFYDIMEEAFPEDEHRQKENQRELFDEKIYNVVGLKEGDKVIGFIAYWTFKDFEYIEHFAVHKDYRNNNEGSKMLNEYLKNSHKKIFLEVEYPEDDITKRRVEFYKRLGFYLNDYEYIQPSYEKGKKSVPLKIMSYKGEADEDELKRVKDTLYKYVYKAVL